MAETDFFRKEGEDLVVNNNISSTFFDREWHKLEVQFGKNELRIYLDCHFVGSFAIDVSLDQLLNDTGKIITGSYDRNHKSPTVSVGWNDYCEVATDV